MSMSRRFPLSKHVYNVKNKKYISTESFYFLHSVCVNQTRSLFKCVYGNERFVEFGEVQMEQSKEKSHKYSIVMERCPLKQMKSLVGNK